MSSSSMKECCLVCLAGNPNVGKSTVFNGLTGLRQHTGNWTGKTVDPARGQWKLGQTLYEAVDLPGIYSLGGGTPEERVAADFLAREEADCLVVVLDATALERTLALALELRRRHRNLVICLNLMDEAERLGLHPDGAALSEALQAPVVFTRADQPRTVEALRRVIAVACMKRGEEAQKQEDAPQWSCSPEQALREASALAKRICPEAPRPKRDWDRLLLGKWTAWPLTLLLLFGLLYLTVRGANYPSALLEKLFSRLAAQLRMLLSGLPPTLQSLLLGGLYGTTAKVVSVMLPPMAIFFPLFSILEDLGLLPRLAFLLDRPFAACGSCGRQGLCMCMGCGCNAVGVTGCRIIPNESERIAAVLTNALVPCNGRFPTLILLAGLLLGRSGELSALATAGILTFCLLLACAVTLGSTALLRRTILRGERGSFVLELPPFRRPRLAQLLLRSILDRTLRVLGRAVCVAAPAGVLIWILTYVQLEGTGLLSLMAGWLEPLAVRMGLSGTLLLAFVLSFPANELLLPLAVLIGTAGSSFAADGGTASELIKLGVGPQMALCGAVFTLFHWPCSTTVLTVWHETRRWKWTLLSVLLPTLVGVVLCLLIHALWTVFS
ncbi:MAG: ferrous iron transporter B [Oscillospiraceae bacterium]|nr:ferrous iron transporter B [Oscillospiraceae bacterium]